VADTGILLGLGVALIFAGVLVITLAAFLLSVKSAGKGKFSGGGAVIIGPFPIIFGTDKKALKTVLLMSLALAALLLVAMLVYHLLLR
jgi:uncharacterized protein (TIGR00304 family)